jgi:chemotaxis protein methyltransferase CheR
VDSQHATWAKLRAFVKNACGVVFTDDQEYLLEARLGPVASDYKYGSVADLVSSISTLAPDSVVVRAVIDAMTTHETLFFRDAAFWRTLDEEILPKLSAQLHGRRLRIWSAACSNGQEPYSIAMLLEERWPDLARNVEIIASDVSAPAIERARIGFYNNHEVNRGLASVRLLRHFQQEHGGFQVKQSLRDRIQWSVHNLLSHWPDPYDCDIVMCRNVLIYFSDSDRTIVLNRIEAAARPGGLIGLGCTETSPRKQIVPGWYEKPGYEPIGAPAGTPFRGPSRGNVGG